MSNKNVLAIDFGTANTYYCKCAGDQLSPQGVDFGDGRDGIATAILYRKDKSPLIGNTALAEYGDATPQERAAYKLRTNFKPDIARSEEAKRVATDFLATILEESRLQRLDIEPAERQVIFGVPSEAGSDYREALSEVAREAGYGEIMMVDEPKGALLYHVFHKDLPVRDALRGLLVVDFGGGTCDFAFLYRGEVRHSWGDMNLGGRLFDDLFFQWFLDENPGALETIRKDGNEFFIHWYLCREIKEFFSRTMARDRTEKVTKAVHQYGRISNMTWDAFLKRASSYSPSATFKQFLQDLGCSGWASQADTAPVNLLEWFRSCLVDGLRQASIDKADIRFVILAGGSSQWPFVPDILQEELRIESKQIMRSDRPYAAISEGLAILPALQARNKAIQQKLQMELPKFLNSELKPLVRRRIETIAEEIGEAVTRELFDEKIKPILLEFRSKGGSIASLKGHIASVAASFEPRLRTILQEKSANFTKGLPYAVKELVSKWFNAHGLRLPEDDVVVEGVDPKRVAKPNLSDVDFYDNNIIEVISICTIALTTVITAMICGGSGMALIASGPIGWIIGAILGLVISLYGTEKAKQMAEEWDVPGWVLKMVLTDSKIAETRNKMLTDIKSAAQQEMTRVEDKIIEQISNLVKHEIEALSDINHIG